ncbi:MAG: lysostaphin resistance A-like protein [Akkermansiaceae bacterium]
MENPYTSPSTEPDPVMPPTLPKAVWNGWWTLLWVFTLLAVWITVQTIGMGIYMAMSGLLGEMFSSGGTMKEEELMARMMDGDTVGVIAFISIFAVCPLAWFMGKIKKPWGGMEYLGTEKVVWWKWLMWLGITFGLMITMSALGPALGMDEMHDSMVDMATSTDYPILLFLGIAVGAPFVEEFIFRGIAWRGWRKSVGLWGTIAITTVIWSLLHVQYMNEPPIFIFLAVFGIVLGLAREYTGNIWVPVAMHALNNGISAIAMLTADLPS